MNFKWAKYLFILFLMFYLSVDIYADAAANIFLFSDMDKNNSPIKKESFTITDDIYISIDFKNYSAKTPYTFKVYNPGNRMIYKQTNTKSKNRRRFIQHRRLHVKSFLGAGKGRWTIRFYYAKKLLKQSHFLFNEPGKDYEYLIYKPKSFKRNNGLLIIVHGGGRTARSVLGHLHFFKNLSEKSGLLLVVPYFSTTRFKSYQLLFEKREDLQLKKIISKVSKKYHADKRTIYFWGHSGGGQFIHRYILFYPDGIKSAIVSGPGFWTFPDYNTRYPYGLSNPYRVIPEGLKAGLKIFTRVPIAVFTGEFDNRRDASLNKSKRADHQGRNRVERAVHWTNHVKYLSLWKKQIPKLRLFIIKNARHGNTRGKSIEKIQNYFFNNKKMKTPGITGSLKIIKKDSRNLVLKLLCYSNTPGMKVYAGTSIKNMKHIKNIRWRSHEKNFYSSDVEYKYNGRDNFIYVKIAGPRGNASDLFGDRVE